MTPIFGGRPDAGGKDVQMDATDPGLRNQLEAALGGGYKLGRELGGGGMSRVFLAEDTHLGRRVAVKVLHPDLAADVSGARFAREVQVAARLQHPHVVPLFTAGETGRLLYYTMPYVDGESLRQRLAREGALPLRDAVRLMRELADALRYAHGQGVVHRDLKPENVLLSGGHATIADFGIAKALSAATTAAAPVTATSAVLGTPLYMAPEQAAADPRTDHRADLYALGLIAYELLCGLHPFAGRGPQAVLAAHLTETPPPLVERRRDVPQVLNALVGRLLAKRPEDRPQSAAEVIRLLDELPIESHESPPGVTRQSPSRRRRAVAAAAALTLVVLAIAAALVARRPPAAEPPVLVVLPFENLGPASDEYFADGLTDEVTSRLAGVSGLRVIGRASARRYKGTTKAPREIARELGATHLLTGTVRWERAAGAPGRVRVSPGLVRADDEATVWAEPYEAPLSDVFRVQATVAGRVADALGVALLARERRAVVARPTANLAAYDAYLRGLGNTGRGARYSVPAQEAAIAEFGHAVALDPAFAAAHARLADAYVATHDMTGDSTMVGKARTHSTRAWALDSTIVETRLARARYLAAADDPEGAHAVVAAAARDAPANAEILFRLAEAEEARGRPERGIPVATRAAELDPRSADAPAQLAGLHTKTHRYAESIPIRDREIALAPENTAAYLIQASAYLLWRADTAAARRVVERGGPALEAFLVRLPSGSAGRAIWRDILSPSVLRAKDTLTLAGHLAGGWSVPPELFHLTKARHFALGGRTDRVRAHADSLAAQLEPALRTSGDARLVAGFYSRRATLAEAYAYLGRTADASREIDRHVAEARRARNATVLPFALVNAAYVDVITGRHDLAVGRLGEALRLPSGMVISPALLRADASWAPLRAHPGFKRLTAGG